MSLRKVQLFDKKSIVVKSTAIQEILSKMTASSASPDGSLWLGTSDGRLCRIDASFSLVCVISAFPTGQQVFSIRSAKQAILALGNLSADGSARLCAYHLYRTVDEQPTLIGSVRIPPEMSATCFDVAFDFSHIAVGCRGGKTLIYSGTSFGRAGIKPVVLMPEEENPSRVSAVRLSGSDKLFIVTEKEVTSVKLSNGANVINTDSSQFPLASSSDQVTLSGDILLIAKPEAVFGFSHEQGNVTALSLLDNVPDRIDAWRQYILFYTAQKSISIVASYPSGTRFIAGTFSTTGEVLGICPSVFDGHSVVVFSRIQNKNGQDVSVSILREKPVSEQLDALTGKYLFEWAIDVAGFEHQSKTVLTELYRKFGDYHFDKDEFEKSMSVFIRAAEAGLPLETSYPINKFLLDENENSLRNTFKLKHVSQYLLKLHGIGGALLKAEHTTLLLLILESLNEPQEIQNVFNLIPEASLLEICTTTPAFLDKVSIDSLERAFKFSGKRCLELLIENQKFERFNETVKNADIISIADIIKTSPLVKSAICVDPSLIHTLTDPYDSAHASYCHSKSVPSASALTSDSLSSEFLKLLLELTLRTKGNCKEIVRVMINRGLANDALLLCKQLGAPSNVILPLCASLNSPFDALAYPAIPLEDVISSIPSSQNMTLYARAVARRSDCNYSDLKISNSDDVAVAVLLETADPGSSFGSIKGALLSEFEQLEQKTADRISRSENDSVEISRMKNEISLLKRKPQIHNLGRPCALCKVPLSEFPVILFKCLHGFHQQCALDWVECRICALESQQHKEILTQRKQAVNKHDELFKCMAGSKGSRFDVAMAYLGHGLFSH